MLTRKSASSTIKLATMRASRKLKVFLCHSKDDKLKVRKLYRRLVDDGFETWLDEANLMPGQDWDFEIRRGVREADVVLVCLSDNSITKEGYVQKEIRFALDIADEKPEGTNFLIPVRLENCSVPNRISRFQWVDLFQRIGYSKLQESLILRMKDLNIRFDSNEVFPKPAEDSVRIPIIGSIAADLPLPELKPKVSYMTDNDANTVEIARVLLPTKVKGDDLFALEVKGESMSDAMLEDSDIVVLKPAISARNGEMVAVWLPQDNEATLKYFFTEKDHPKVRALYHRLVADGFDAWLDEEKLIPGQDWDLEIRKVVRSSDVVIVCLSKNSITRAGYVQKEIRFALDIADEQPDGAIFIIPARLEDCETSVRLSKWQWVDLFEGKGYQKLKSALELRIIALGLQNDKTLSSVLITNKLPKQKNDYYTIRNILRTRILGILALIIFAISSILMRNYVLNSKNLPFIGTIVTSGFNGADDKNNRITRLRFNPVLKIPGIQINNMAAGENDVYILNAKNGHILHATFIGGYLKPDTSFSCQPGTYAGYQIGALIDILALPVVNAIDAKVLVHQLA